MNENCLPDYLEHMQQAADDACSFVEGLSKDDFLEDRRTRQAVIMSLVIIGEAATKIMDTHLNLCRPTPKYCGAVCEVCAIVSLMATLILTWKLYGIPCKRHCRN